MQREQILEHALNVLEQNGLAATLSLENLAGSGLPSEQLRLFWPDRDALLYDALRYHGQQIETWRRQILLDASLSADQKLMARYEVLSEQVSKGRFRAACLSPPAASTRSPISPFTSWPSSRNAAPGSLPMRFWWNRVWITPAWSPTRWS